MAQKLRAAKEIEDEEFDKEMEVALGEDKELLKMLAKV